jgi:hypothetical protein
MARWQNSPVLEIVTSDKKDRNPRDGSITNRKSPIANRKFKIQDSKWLDGPTAEWPDGKMASWADGSKAPLALGLGKR